MTQPALIFDVDGTLAETEEAHRAAFNRAFAEACLDWHWTRDMYRDLLNTTGGVERMGAYRATLGTEVPSDATLRDIHRAKTAIYGGMLAGGAVTLRPGVRELIDGARARGLPCAVATTTSRPNVDALTQSAWGVPATDIFDVIATGEEVAAKKPAPDLFQLALSRLDLPADQAIAFEDSLNGLRSAQGAGLRVVVTPDFYTEHQDHSTADWLVSSLMPADLSDDLAHLLGVHASAEMPS